MTDKEIIDKLILYNQTREKLLSLEKELKDILYDKVVEGRKKGW